MLDKSEALIPQRAFKDGPVIYQPEDYLIDEHKAKKTSRCMSLIMCSKCTCRKTTCIMMISQS